MDFMTDIYSERGTEPLARSAGGQLIETLAEWEGLNMANHMTFNKILMLMMILKHEEQQKKINHSGIN